jgi:chloramphenicol-sensitive protein RarD
MTRRGLNFHAASGTAGFLYACSAQILWALLTLYWKVLSPVQSIHVLAARIFFSFVFVTLVMFARKNFAGFRMVRKNPRGAILTGALITINWGVFIFAIQSGNTLQASIGNYIGPIVSIVLGLVALKEKISALQKASVALAALGVGILTAFAGVFPWIAAVLALAFSLYGFFKKTISAGPLEGLCAETLVSLPVAAALLFFPPGSGAAYLTGAPPFILALVVCAGPVTAFPLYLFAKGAKLIPLSTMGFLQFIGPTMQFFMGVFLFGEPFPLKNLIPFSLIWAAAILYVVSYSVKRAS